MPQPKILLTGSVLLALLVGGCTPPTQSVRPPDTAAPQDQAALTASSLTASGDFRGAARIYQQLASRTPSPNRETYLLLAAENLLQAEDLTGARQAADALDPRNLYPDQRYRLYLLYGDLELQEGRPLQALEKLDRIPPERLPAATLIRFHQLRINAFSLSGKLLESARERARLAPHLQAGAAQTNNTALLEIFTLLPEQDLERLRSHPSGTLVGWVELATIIRRQAPESTAFNLEIQDWRARYPNHPVDSVFALKYAQSHAQAMRPPETIAVMLPESGPYAEAAQAIRDGLASAYFQQQANFRPVLKFYDTQTESPYAIYQKAITEGADFVLGPLDKDKLRELATAGELTQPVLAFNQSPGLSKANLYQFGLNPEDEVEQAASSAWFDGHHSALVLIPDSGFGRRIADHFNHYWAELGGVVLETQTYHPGESDFSIPIKQLLNLDQSEQRYQQLKKLEWGLKFEARRRTDADFVFLIAQPREARLLRPQLQFYRASRLPVYATSHVYSGRQNPTQDRDLSDIIFCDIPWLFDLDADTPITIHEAQNTWKALPTIYLRLMAMGIDAYQLIPQLHRLQNLPDTRYAGVTGTLSLNPDNHIIRQLHCAQFKEGIAVPRGLAPHLKADAQPLYPTVQPLPINAP